jgi:crotonobetainyl-CoA:carnitine CoA-transferase CaiB-like acyl-CoA transferase
VLHEQFAASLSPQDVLDADNAWKNIARVSQALDVVELERSLVAAGVPAAQSTSLRTAMSDSRLTERQALQSIFHDALGEQVIVALPWFVDGAPYAVRGPAPVLGADRDDVLREWLGAP